MENCECLEMEMGGYSSCCYWMTPDSRAEMWGSGGVISFPNHSIRSVGFMPLAWEYIYFMGKLFAYHVNDHKVQMFFGTVVVFKEYFALLSLHFLCRQLSNVLVHLAHLFHCSCLSCKFLLWYFSFLSHSSCGEYKTAFYVFCSTVCNPVHFLKFFWFVFQR